MTTYVRRRKPERVDIYTDGACSGAPGPGGWAYSTLDGSWQDSGACGSTTNQRVEMLAVIHALRAIAPGQPVTIVTDAAYVMNCFTEHWYRGWKDGKKRRSGDPVANWDLWKILIPLVQEHDVQWRKVKGHSKDPGNDYVDMLAVKAKKALMK